MILLYYEKLKEKQERLEDNLFEPLSQKSTAEFQAGDGKEIPDNPNAPPAKMQAVHSSSAFAVNIFLRIQKTKTDFLVSSQMLPGVAVNRVNQTCRVPCKHHTVPNHIIQGAAGRVKPRAAFHKN